MRYLILGATEARDENGGLLPLGGSRLRALLAALALRPGRPVTVAELVDDVWADDPPADAPAALQALVGRLRRVLGKEALASTPGGYRLTAGPDDVDLYVFEHLAGRGGAELEAGAPDTAARTLRTALALWRGPALADLPDGDHGHALRPEAQRLAALERRIEADLRRATGEGRGGAVQGTGVAPSNGAVQGTGVAPSNGAHPGTAGLTTAAASGGAGLTTAASGAAGSATAASGAADSATAASGTAGPAVSGAAGPATAVSRTASASVAAEAAPTPGDGPNNVHRPGNGPPATGSAANGTVTGTATGTATPNGPGPHTMAASHGPATTPNAASSNAASSNAAGPHAAGVHASAPRPAALAAELTELIAAHPYDERFRAQLIRALRADGRQADALAAYEDARRALADGLGTDPGPELTALHRELLAPAPPAPAETGVFHVKPARGNLRPRLTSFVGREPELRAIHDDLTRSRLVTLTGPGGSGKTRLAEESAACQAPAGTTPPDVWIAELAPVEAPDAVPGAVLSALGLRETALLRDNSLDGTLPRTDPVDLLVDRLGHGSRPAPVLLILDNCEHVIGAAAALAETLLTRCPQLRILATSREPLAVPGESVRPVDPLPADPAHRLFTERARAVRPGFDPDHEPAHDPDAVAEICRRLDGLPLAIELAAARLRLLGPRQIADRLDDRFRLLTGGSRTVLPRQQTLRAVVDWSWDLLDEDERTALRQVSVFAGGWDLTAAEAVIRTSEGAGRPAAATADLLGALVDKSLVVAAPAVDGAMRYRLLETIHEYAVERCAEAPQVRAAAESAHTAYFLGFVEEAEPRLRSGDQLPWIQRLETDLDNIRAALQRTTASGLSEPEAARLVLGMGWFWWLRNYRSEGLAWTQKARTLGPEPTDESDPRYWPRMNLHLLWFFFAAESGQSEIAQADARTHELVNRVADAFAASHSHSVRFPGLLWPMTSYLTGTTEDTREKIDEAVDNAREHGGAWEYGVILMFRAHMLVDMPGGMPGIDDDLAELRALSRRVGDRWMRAQVASAAAEAGMMRGRYDEASTAYEEALLLAREVGAHAEAPFLLARLAELSYRTGDLAAAHQRLDSSEAEAERHQAHDATAYTHYLRATMAFHRGDIADARRMLTVAQEQAGRGGPPSHFTVAMSGLSARITVHEPGPDGGTDAGARGLTEALVAAKEAQCAEIVTGHLADGAVTVLSKLGHHAAVVRILAAADNWRHLSSPRTEGEQAEIDAVERLCREELGARRYEEERAAGVALTLGDVIDVLKGIVADLPVP
ncbi:BTAD domain-containing putative transcriptional regulator [Streptomyces castrisilvae]|uniref:BTAD domain-containing putative transcriptional regulator n=1 Tax=Streptomyces castrisilvae TaxID=3033811 RepID=A0ABY9HLB6_9ACTN|nr:BTAD domain-containing putative transcriptional regulator [Streptomyces sp. Mut1]WLQ35214.1 BTAD domain-containing putative transcriptional regulator [Streptomyces sp. Mut1]